MTTAHGEQASRTPAAAATPAPTSTVTRASPTDADYPALSQPCEVAAAEPFRGRAPDADTLAQLQKATGAFAVRLAPAPGKPMSMERMVGRLTVTLDASGNMLHFACE